LQSFWKTSDHQPAETEVEADPLPAEAAALAEWWLSLAEELAPAPLPEDDDDAAAAAEDPPLLAEELAFPAEADAAAEPPS
jgi:hypothetical protein